MTKRKAKIPPRTPKKNAPKKRRGVRINKPQDVRRLLSKLINQTLWDDIETDKLRAVSYACQTILKVFEIVSIEERLAEIEDILNEIRQEN